jgi:probable rRNA maturation factor
MQMIKFISCPDGLIEKDILKDTITYFADKDGFKIKKLEYNFVDLSKMQSLNNNFLNHKNDTDIITFDYSEGKTIIAEVFISIEMMRDNAQKYVQSVDNECIRLISHGLFHCLGYKDKLSEEKEIMRKKEEEFIFAVSRETNQDV